MTKKSTRGAFAERLSRPVRLGLGAAVALFAFQAPLAHADAFGSAAASKADQEMNARLQRLEQRITDLAQQAATAQQPGRAATPGVPGGAAEALQLDFTVKARINGGRLIKQGDKLLMVPDSEFKAYEKAAQVRARTSPSLATASPVPGEAPTNTVGGLNTPPPPPQVANPAPPKPMPALSQAKPGPAK